MVPDAALHPTRVKPRSRIVRGIYFTLGIISLGLAFISFLPGIPTYDPLILAAFFFSKSSDRFHAWLLSHALFGRIIRGYQAGLPVRMKIGATVGIIASLAMSAVFLTDNRGLRTLLAAVGIFAVWYVWTRPGPQEITRPHEAFSPVHGQAVTDEV